MLAVAVGTVDFQCLFVSAALPGQGVLCLLLPGSPVLQVCSDWQHLVWAVPANTTTQLAACTGACELAAGDEAAAAGAQGLWPALATG